MGQKKVGFLPPSGRFLQLEGQMPPSPRRFVFSIGGTGFPVGGFENPVGGFGKAIGGFEKTIGGFRAQEGGFRGGMVVDAQRKEHRQAAMPFLSGGFGPKSVSECSSCLQSTRLNR